MCGITGIFHLNNKPIDPNILKNMTDVLQHRGPDDAGYYTNNNVGLGHRRLSIIDLHTGKQPIFNEDKSIVIVFNGEIYNFQELRKQLLNSHTFKTKTDTEVIIHLYEEYGIDCVKQLRGMFAFAIYDTNKKQLFLARDRLGQKPLYYYLDREKNIFLFGSEIKSILEYPNIQFEPDYTGIHYYLTFQYVPEPYSAFKNIKKLNAAQTLTIDINAKISTYKYWELSFNPNYGLTEKQIQQQLREILIESTKIRLISDVPLGAFLSGGIDSSLVVGLMSQLKSDPVKTYSIGFSHKLYNETHYAKIAAQKFNTDHKEYTVEWDIFEIIKKLVWHYNEPFADSSMIPTYYVSKMTRENVTVALSGDGGDESFAGYRRYKAIRLNQIFNIIPQTIRSGLFRLLTGLLKHNRHDRSNLGQGLRLLEMMSLPQDESYLFIISHFNDKIKKQIYTADFLESTKNLNPFSIFKYHFDKVKDLDIVSQTQYIDIMTYLNNDILTKVDIASMMVSLETRSPFLDHKLIEFAAQIPVKYKLNYLLRGKHILKETFKDIIPKQILNRKKMGFGIPISEWFKNELRDFLYDNLMSDKFFERNLFNENAIKKLIDEHQNNTRDHGYRLWNLLILELWFREFIDK